MIEHNPVAGVYNSHTEAEADLNMTAAVGVRHEEVVHCGQGLSHRRARHRLLQYR